MRIPTNPPLFVNYSAGWYKILEMTMGSSHHNNWYAIAPSPTHPTKLHNLERLTLWIALERFNRMLPGFQADILMIILSEP
jgi:hypothetical protein